MPFAIPWGLVLKGGVVLALLLAVKLAASAAQAHFQDDRDTRDALATAVDRVAAAETRLVDAVLEHSREIQEMQDALAEERIARVLAERNYAEANDRIADLVAAAQDEKAKYTAGRLARLAAAKGGLLTRLAKSSAAKRNAEWEALSR